MSINVRYFFVAVFLAAVFFAAGLVVVVFAFAAGFFAADLSAGAAFSVFFAVSFNVALDSEITLAALGSLFHAFNG